MVVGVHTEVPWHCMRGVELSKRWRKACQILLVIELLPSVHGHE